MPHRLAPSALLLAPLLLGGGPAAAQQATGWVDPPARVRPPAAEPASPAPAPNGIADGRGAAGAAVAGTASAKGEVRPPAPVAATRAPSEGPRGARRQAEDRTSGRHREPVESAAAGGSRDREAAARRFASAYLASISAPNAAAVAATPRFYGDHVRFHGRGMSTEALIAEKRGYFRRWPERRYAALDGRMHSACEPQRATCTVTTLMGFRAESPGRGARSQGVGQLTLTVSFTGDRPVIVSESSRVLQRGSAALTDAERGRPGA